MGLTYAEAKRLGIAHLYPAGGKDTLLSVVPPAATRAPKDPMNKTEHRFASSLGWMKDRHLIKEWDFEPEKFRMADRTWFKPDFRVTLNSGQNVFIEVKCAKANGSVWWRDDAAVKAKTVPELHPYAFFLAVWGAQRWTVVRLPSRRYGWIGCDIELWWNL